MGQNRGLYKPSVRAVRRFFVILLWIVVWQLASMAIGTDLLLAGPISTFTALVRDVVEPAFLSTVGFTLTRVMSGFILAFILALVLGILSTSFSAVYEFIAPVLSAMKSVPVACIVVLLLIWIGSRNVSFVAVVFVALPALYFSVTEACSARDTSFDALLKTLRVSRIRRWLATTWPDLVPFLIASGKTCVGMSWKAGVAAELIGIPQGSMGDRVYQAKLLFDTADLFAWTIVVVLLAWASERLFLWLLGSSRTWALNAACLSRPGGDSQKVSKAAEIALHEVTVSYGDLVVGPFEVNAPAGSRMVFTDPSGAGKTTALRILLGFERAYDGEVLRPKSPSCMFQTTKLVEDMSAEANLVLACDGLLSYSDSQALLLELLPASALDRPVRELSGGMRRRVELARALAVSSDAVLLDEPFSSLDDLTRKNACEFVLRHLQGRTLLVASHDEGIAALLKAYEEHVLAS